MVDSSRLIETQKGSIAAQPADVLRESLIGIREDDPDLPGTLTKRLAFHWFDVGESFWQREVNEHEARRYIRRFGPVSVEITKMWSGLIAIVPELRDCQRLVNHLTEMFSHCWCPMETGHAYFILAPHSLSVKIGYTGNVPAQRLIQLQVGTPEPLLLLGYMPADEVYTELFLHEHFRNLKIRGEWFQFNSDVADFIRWMCNKRAPDVTLDNIPEFSRDKWNCDPWPKALPRTNKEIEAWLSKPELY